MDAAEGKLQAEVSGEVETEDGVLVLRRVHVVYTLEAPEAQRQLVERVHAMHHRHCPVYRSLEAALDITTELRLVAERG